MKLFSVYTKRLKNEEIEEIEVVKNGFCFLAFAFNIFWFLQHKMWQHSICIIIANFFISDLLQKFIAKPLDIFVIKLSFLLILGLNANFWYEKTLLSKKYHLSAFVFAKSSAEAKLKFISNFFKENPERLFCLPTNQPKNNKKQEPYFSV